ncbi:Uma2 family endonuclease [Laspinema sp. D1]|uniref:Uma2 family endonuclease n=1 Tax=Laspinema palackyanum D2a TaxID=2953684 RepID=A0ABT2MRF6_9CYAN|nr:Uma2 family endonuclease [Laspinema sp. D2a]
MVQTPSKSLTLEEFLQLPETKPASEYLEGEIIQKPMPKGKHSSIQAELIIAITAVVKPKKIARAFPELRCIFDGRAIVPDIAVFTWDRIPRDENGEIANIFTAPPNWLIEILSPEQSQTKVTKKILHALKHGTQMGWLIDPQEKTIFVYSPQQQTEVFDELEQQIPVPAFASDLRLTVAEIFGWLLE